MNKTIRAIYANGVFRPMEPVDLPEETPVEFEPRVLTEAPSNPQAPMSEGLAKRNLGQTRQFRTYGRSE